MSNELAARHCKPCEGGVKPLGEDESRALLAKLHDDWSLLWGLAWPPAFLAAVS